MTSSETTMSPVTARNNLKVWERRFEKKANNLGWNHQPDCLADLDRSDVEAVLAATEQLKRLCNEADTELTRRQNLASAETQVAQVDLSTVPDEDPAAAQVTTKTPVDAIGSAYESARAELNGQVTIAARTLLEEKRDEAVATREDRTARRVYRSAWVVLAAVMFVLGFLLTSGLANIALVVALMLVVLLGGQAAARWTRDAVLRMGRLSRVARVGLVIVTAMVMFGSLGMAGATPWMWAVSAVLVCLVANRAFAGPGHIDVTIESAG